MVQAATQRRKGLSADDEISVEVQTRHLGASYWAPRVSGFLELPSPGFTNSNALHHSNPPPQ